MIEETPLASGDTEAIQDIRKMLYLLRRLEEAIQQIVNDGHLRDFRAQEQEGRGFLQDIRSWKINRNSVR